jgi:membrane-associated phospholipid phosphatase
MPNDQFLRAASARLAILWPVKLVGITLGITVFFSGYFHLLHHPARPPVIMPRLALDDFIGIHPIALPLYLSLWIYLSLAPGLLVTVRELAWYLGAVVVLGGSGLLIFRLWPTAIAAPPVDWAQYPGFAFLKATDAAGNACPSLHAAFAVFTALWLRRHLNDLSAPRLPHLLNGAWCALILWSTVATAQHVSLDVLAGTALGALVGAVAPPRRPAGGRP